MFKRIVCFALSTVLLLGVLLSQASAAENLSVFVDGAEVENAAPALYQGTTYVSLRAVAQALRPDAEVSWSNGSANVTADGLSITVAPGSSYLQANGRYLYLPYQAMLINGVTMVPVRALAQALDAQVEWDASTNTVYLTSGSGAITSGDAYYNANDLYWLSHIIYAESGNQSLEGKIGVGNVILNRVRSSLFPGTVQGVICQANQFSPVSNGTIYREPNAESVLAAKLCLDGAVVLPTALWFNTAGLSCWASRNRPYLTTIGGHTFYS